jgi:hypothetical protein
MDENTKKLIAAAKKAVAEMQAMDPREHFWKMVEKGLINPDGTASENVPGGTKYVPKKED